MKKQSKPDKNQGMQQSAIIIGIVVLISVLLLYGIGAMHQAVWFMDAKTIKVTDNEIQFYVGIAGESWRVDLRDSNQTLINSKTGHSAGTHAFPRPVPGTYYLSIWCFYGSSTCTSNNIETVIVHSNTGTLELTSSPKGATIKIDGLNKGTTPLTITGQLGGIRTVSAELDGYLNFIQTVSVINGTTNSLSFEMIPVPRTLQLVSDPAGAVITELKPVGDIYFGLAPQEISIAYREERSFQFSKTGYTTKTIKIIHTTKNPVIVELFPPPAVTTYPPPVVTTYPPEPTATQPAITATGTAKATPINTDVEKEIQCPPGTYLNQNSICTPIKEGNELWYLGGIILIILVIAFALYIKRK